MAKRRLTKRQQTRISQKQKSGDSELDTSISESNLQTETVGFVVAHFGTQVAVQSSQEPFENQRAFVRANVDKLVVGDKVRWQPGTDMGVVNSRLDRRNVFERPDFRGHPKAVAANIDQLFIVIAPEPEPHGNLIDRYLVACRYYNMDAVIVLNKVDLQPELVEPIQALLKNYSAIGYNCLEVSSKSSLNLDSIKRFSAGQQIMLAGQSGVGKSSLTNALVPEAAAEVGALSHAAAKGKHTTTASHWFALDHGGGLIDSPGIREFALDHLDADDIVNGFVECAELDQQCQFRDCNHLNAKGCAISAAAESGKISAPRYNSLIQLLTHNKQTAS